MPNAHGEYIWYELMTIDPVGAKKFYDDVVGWNIDAEAPPNSDMDYRMINVGDGQVGGVMALNADMVAGGASPTWLGYIGVDDVDASVAATVAAGGAVHLPAFDIPGVGRIAMVTDPQGAPFYLMRGAVEGETSTAFSVKGQGHCAWNELVTSDSAAALDFYTKAFNWDLPEPMDMGPMGKYHFIESGGTPIGAVCGPMPDMGPPKWNYYFRVPSIDAAVEKVKAGGGAVTQGPHEVPGEEWVIIGNDPQGATFCLVGGK